MHLRDLTQFLKELGENNNRPWFIMNKPRYDILREEFLAVVVELLKELARFDQQIVACNPKKALFRVNRDIRFSNDKRPYKTNFSAAMVPNDLKRPKDAGGPVYYFEIDGTGRLLFGAGEYMPPPARLRAIREHIVNDAPGFGKMIKNKAMRATFGELQPEGKLQRPPKGFDPGHPHIEAIRNKSFFVWTEVKLKVNAPEQLVADLARGLKDSYPLVTWLRGVPTTPPQQ